MKETGVKRRIMWTTAAGAAIVISAASSFAFPQNVLEIRAVGVLLGSLILWISEALPISVAALLMVCLLPFLGLMDFSSVISSFGTNTALFIMASSGLTVALASSSVPGRLTLLVLKRSGAHPKRLIFSVGILTALFSSMVSSLATCTLFTALLSTALKESGVTPKQSNLGRDLMMVIPACAGIGGFMSPAGTPANILVMDLLEKQGVSITFAKWCAVGFPIGLLASFIFILFVILIFKPENIVVEAGAERPKTWNKQDYAVITVVTTVIIGWFAGSFVPVLSTTLVAILGMAILFLPGLGVLDMNTFSKGVNWDLVLAMGSVSILMSAISDTGLLARISSALFGSFLGLPPILMLSIISFCICVMRAFIPTTTAVIALFAPMMISLAEITGLSIDVMMLIVSFWAASALLLVYTEPIYLIAYKENYFSEKDLLRTGIIPSVLLSFLSSCGLLFLCRLVGIA